MILEGTPLAAAIRQHVKEEIATLNEPVTLAVVIVGENPASQVYVRNKETACTECGISAITIPLDENSTEYEVGKVLDDLAADPSINGILLQLPLPKHLIPYTDRIIARIPSVKDVDCLNGTYKLPSHFTKSDKHAFNHDVAAPCTPKGICYMLESCGALESSRKGESAVVIGRSNIVGKPVADMLLALDKTVTIVHSKTPRDIVLKACQNADIIISACGVCGFITDDFIIDKCPTIIDVSINRNDEGKLCGDVDKATFERLIDKGCTISPVPKGVGPMTVACLMENVLLRFKEQKGLL